MLFRQTVLKHSAKLTIKHLRQRHFFNKSRHHQCFHVIITKFFRNRLLYNVSSTTFFGNKSVTVHLIMPGLTSRWCQFLSSVLYVFMYLFLYNFLKLAICGDEIIKLCYAYILLQMIKCCKKKSPHEIINKNRSNENC